MNNKAQASLEYLMTYGWALIMIATVIGVLVFITSVKFKLGQGKLFKSGLPYFVKRFFSSEII